MQLIKNLKILILALVVCTSQIHGQITIRPTTMDDFESIAQFVEHAYETHFKTIYTNGYTHMAWGQNPDHFIKLKISGLVIAQKM